MFRLPRALCALILFAPALAIGQTPVVSENVPAESFLGEGFCFEADVTNSGAPGFGPYLRLDLPPGLSFDSAQIFGIAGSIIDLGVFPAAPGNELTDPLIDQAVTGTEGHSLRILEFPVGSVVSGGPPLPVEICLTIDPSAEVGTPLPIGLTPVYEFGDTATGTNGPIIGTEQTPTVTPTVLLFDKQDNAPESERPPGPSWPYDYTLTVDIANTATIEPLVIRDVLPPDLQFVGSVSVAGGAGCSVTQAPSLAAPGGSVEVTCTGPTVGTASAADVVVEYSGYITDVLNEAACDIQPQVNEASVQATYVDQSATAQPLPPVSAATTVSAEHVVVQKGAAPGQGVAGDTVTYTLQFQVTDFGDADGLVVTDVLPDGLDFDAHGSLTVNGAPVAISPQSVITNPDATETIVYDIGAAAGTLAAGSSATLTYSAVIQQTYDQTGESVLASDSLTNSVVADFDLVQGAAGCSNGSGATVGILPVALTKQIVNPQPFYVPGDTVIFRLTKDVPAGDSRGIRFEDYLPLPIFDVSDINLTFGTDIVYGPGDTAGLVPDAITVDAGQNALFIDWPDLDSLSAETIQVDLSVTVTDDPFADSLFLTNILRSTSENTSGQTAVSTGPVSFNVGAPVLEITKGISATDQNGTIDPPASMLPVDGDITGVDAGDAISYVITVENVGSAQAFDVVITDPGAAELTGCTVASVTDGNGAALGTTGTIQSGLLLDDPLAANDGTPGAPFGADTALVTLTCEVVGTIEPGTSWDNTATATWASLGGAVDFPAVSDTASASSAEAAAEKYFIDSSEPATSNAASPPRVAIGEIVRYRLAARIPEGRIPNVTVRDLLPAGLQFIDDGTATAALVCDGACTATAQSLVNRPGGAAAPGSLASALVSTPIAPGSILGGPFGDGTDPTFAFGDVVNGDDDADDEFLVVEFNALVLNTGANQQGTNRTNRFDLRSAGTEITPNSNGVTVRIAEPAVSLDKSATPTSGDAGDVIAFTLNLANGTGGNVTPAHEVSLTDTLPAGLVGLTVSGVTPTACPGLTITDNTVGDALDLFFSVMAPGCSIAVEFDATLTPGVAPGTNVTNTAFASWTSLPGAGTGSNPTGSTPPGASGTATGERTGAGGVNDYADSDPAAVGIPDVGIAKSVVATSEPETGDGEARPGIEDLAIGESASFEIVVTVPEGTTPQVVITDTLPFTNGVMRVDSAAVLSVGANLTPDVLSPAPIVTDAQLGDGIDDTVAFDFGQVVNSPDGVIDDDDRIRVGITATLVDEAANANLDPLTNTALVRFGPGLNASATADIDVVEPILTVDKSGSINTGDAGDSVLYTVTIQHSGASAADAQDVVLQDVLPADLTLNVGSITQTSGTPLFVTNTSAGNTIALGWTDIPRGEIIEIQYSAVLDSTVSPGELLTNTAEASWTSIAGPSTDERTRSANDDHQVLVTEPGIDKQVVATSEPSTGSGQFGAPEDLTIGEEVTYRFTVQFPEGTSEAAEVIDQLPTGASVLQLVSSRIVSIGANLSGAGLPTPGTSGVPSDSDGDTVNDRATWLLGDVLNTPDGVNNAADVIEFEVVAVVLDLPSNQSGDVDQLNVATLVTTTSTVNGSAAVDLVEPDVDIAKTVVDPADGFVDAGDVVTARLVLDHRAGSTADAFNLQIADTLPAGLSWGGDGSVTSDCPGLTTDSSGAPIVVFDVPTLDRATDTCFIEYQFTVDSTVMPGAGLVNTAALAYDSTPVVVPGRTRTYSDSDTAEVTVIAPSLVKVAVDTSQPDTDMAQGDPALLDLTIGETVTYELTLVFPEGLTTGAQLIDVLPAGPDGVLEAIGATVTAVGGNISTTLPGTPVFTDLQLGDGLDDTVTFDFGDVTNLPDGIDSSADRIVVEIVARVADVGSNIDGALLTNLGQFSYTGNLLEDSADVEVVEPAVDLTKSMALELDGTVRLTLSLSNTGSAPAYDLDVTDVFDEADWDLAGFSPVSVPGGFELVLQPDTPVVGQQTLRFRTDSGAVSPDGTLPVGSSVSAVFDLPLAVLPPTPNPLPNTADLVGGDTLPGPDPNARDLPPDSGSAQIAVPDLQLSKTATLQVDADGSTDVSPGDTLRYTLTLDNTGAGPATNIAIDDTPDANTALVVGSVTTSQGSVTVGNTTGDTDVRIEIASVAGASSVTITYDTLIDDPLALGVTEVVNQATFDSDELPPGTSDDPDPPGPDDPTVVPVNAQPDLTLVKDDGGVSTTPGGVVVYTLEYANVGNQAASGVDITETVPVATTFDAGASDPGWSCVPDAAAGSVCTLALGTVAAGTSGSVAFAVVVDNPAPPGLDQIDNTASIGDDGANGADPTPGNNSDSDSTPLSAAPDLTITKDDGGASTVPNGVVVYTLTFENVGDQDATGVVITDTVPANTSFEAGPSSSGWVCAPDASAGSACTLALGTIPAGTGGSAAFAVRIDDPLPVAVNQVDNLASIADDGSNGADPTPGNNADGDTTPVNNSPALAVDKALTSAPSPIEVGSVLVYTITATNTGNATLTNVIIVDSLITPTGGTAPCASLAPSDVCTLIGEYVVTQPDIDAGGVLNTATGDSDQTGPDVDQVTVPIAQNPALDLVKTASLNDANGNGVADAGETIDYIVTVTNTGNVTLSNVDVVDPLIVLSCAPATPVATLPPAGQIDCVGTLTVTAAQAGSGLDIDNTASTTGIPPGGGSVGDSDSTSTGVCPVTTGQITGTIWNDLDRDDLIEAGEPRLTSFVTLGAPGAPPEDLLITTADPTTGEYSFPDVEEGTWEVRVLEAYLANNFDLYAVQPAVRSVALTRCGTEVEDYNFAAALDGVVGDFVWFDFNENQAIDEFRDGDGNGVLTLNPIGTPIGSADFEWVDLNQNGSPDLGEFNRCGLADVTVELLDAGGGLLDTTRTNLRGEYFFQGLALDASYSTRVDLSDPANVASAQQFDVDGNCLELTPRSGASPAPERGGPTPGCGATTPTSFSSAVLTSAGPVDDSLDYGVVCGIAGQLDLVKVLSDNADEDMSGSVTLGDTLTYTVTATNTGSVLLSDVVVTDTRITPSSITCPLVDQGDSCVLVGTTVVTQADVDAGGVFNEATAGSDQTPPQIVDLTVPIVRAPDLDLVKTATLNDLNGNELGDAGEVIDYELVATNTGNTTLVDVEILDPLIEPLSCTPPTPASLAPGDALVCTGSLEISAAILSLGQVENEATAVGTGPDGTEVDSSSNTVTLLNAPLAIPALNRIGLILLILAMLGLAWSGGMRRVPSR